MSLLQPLNLLLNLLLNQLLSRFLLQNRNN